VGEKVEVTQQKRDGVAVLKLRGRLDSNSSPDFEEEVLALIGSGEIHLVFDLELVDYISSAGLRVFLKLTKDLNARGGRFALCSMKEYIREVFDMSGFALFIPIHANADESVQAILQ
jgi:anti-sigma B factor antagonist